MKKQFFFLLVIAVLVVISCGYNPSTIKDTTVAMSSDNGYNWTMMKASDLNAPMDVVSGADYSASDWQPAIVPGTVLNSLVYNGVYPEPYYGVNNKLNEKIIPDISNVGREFYHYAFRTEFAVPTTFAGKSIQLKVNGINYFADVWLNGKKLGSMQGMFQSAVFDISDIATTDAKNVLLLDVESVEFPGEPESIVKDRVVLKENRNGGDGNIGKNITMLMSVGWDFTYSDGIRDRNTGIWLPIELSASGAVRIDNPFVKTDLPLPDTTRSVQTVIAQVSNSSDAPMTSEIIVEIPEKHLRVSKSVTLQAKTTQEIEFTADEFSELVFKNPKLWWPFKKGAQHLYTLNITALENGSVSDQCSSHFGIREITSDRNTPDDSRVFYVNGSQFFVAGSNWIPEAMLRKSAKRTKAELLYTKQAGINFLRLWGGGISEDETFFNLCDSLGILVWHEFWMTGDTEPPADMDLYYDNVKSTIKRVRKHPSLAYYVSSNEQDDIINIKPILDELDGTRGYQFQSECCGVHDGSPYKYENPMQYYDNTASDRGSRIDGFCPEYGTVCLPPIECLREMMDEKDIFPPNKKVWDYLDGGGFHNMATKYWDAVNRYGTPTSAEDMALKGQLVGAVGYRGVWENWNYNKLGYGDRWASGVLFWYHNSPVRQICGRLWTWSLEPTAALYVTQKALAPLHIQFDYLKNTVSIINHTRHAVNELTATCQIYDINSKLIAESSVDHDLAAEEVANDVLILEFPADISDVHFIALQLLQNGKPVADNFYWRSSKVYEGPWTTTGPAYDGFATLMDMPKAEPEMHTEIINDDEINVTIANDTDVISFFNRIKVVDANGNLVRPVFYSDNYFSILPGKEKTITIDLSMTDVSASDVTAVINGVNR